MKKILVLILIVMMLISTTSNVFANDLGYISVWYSDSTEVRLMTKQFDIYVDSALDPAFHSNLSSYVNHGISLWSGAGRDVSRTYSYSGYEVIVYGGSRTLLQPLFGIMDSSTTGRARYTMSKSYKGYVRLTNDPSKVYDVYNWTTGYNKIAIVNDGSSRTSNQYKKTTAHEIGHAIGWYGHSSNSSDIMKQGAYSTTSLSSRDKIHLNQFY